MLFSHKTFLAVLFVLAVAGCGKSGDKAQPQAEGAGTANPAAAIPSGPAKGGQDPQHPVVILDTSLGAITVKLDREKAPITVDNFLAYVQNGFYDQTLFHQVFAGQCVVGGGYDFNGQEKPAKTEIRNEAHNGLKNVRGAIAMARAADAIDSARSQFFINVADNESLDHQDRTLEGYGYCVFGQVTAGIEVVDKISQQPLQNTPQFERTPVQPVVLKSVRLAR